MSEITNSNELASGVENAAETDVAAAAASQSEGEARSRESSSAAATASPSLTSPVAADEIFRRSTVASQNADRLDSIKEESESRGDSDAKEIISAGSLATEETSSSITSGEGSFASSYDQASKASTASPVSAASILSALSAGSRKNVSVKSARNPVYDLSDAELVNAVQELQKKKKYLQLENMIFLHFLRKHDPSLIEEMETQIKNVQMIAERASISGKRLTLTRHSRRESSFLAPSSSSFLAVADTKEGVQKINLTQRTDLILREIDDIQTDLQKVNKKCNILRHKLKADLEEMSIREAEIADTLETFEAVFINGTSEKYTQKNPADRFARFMEEGFKQTRTIIDKIRLRTSSLKVQYQKIHNQLVQKKLLGQNLQQVDFEQLEIENKRLVLKIEKRNLLLIELKKMNGHANLLLSRTKKHMLLKLDDLKEIQDTIKYREDVIAKLDDDCEKVAAELKNTKEEYDKIKTRSENYEVPAVIEYVKKKAELGTLKKNLKIWSRRKQIKDMALAASVREMKYTTGMSVPRASWFENPGHTRGTADTFEFAFERKEKEKFKMRKRKRKSKL